jgi:hypothetical protein
MPKNSINAEMQKNSIDAENAVRCLKSAFWFKKYRMAGKYKMAAKP